MCIYAGLSHVTDKYVFATILRRFVSEFSTTVTLRTYRTTTNLCIYVCYMPGAENHRSSL